MTRFCGQYVKIERSIEDGERYHGELGLSALRDIKIIHRGGACVSEVDFSDLNVSLVHLASTHRAHWSRFCSTTPTVGVSTCHLSIFVLFLLFEGSIL